MPGCRGKQLIEPDVTHTSSFRGDGAILGFFQAERAETADAHCGPTASNHVVDGPHSFAAPHDAVHFRGVLREVRLDFAREMAAVIRMIEARARGAPAVYVDLGYVRKARDALHHVRKGVVIVPGEEVHSSRLHFGGYRGN